MADEARIIFRADNAPEIIIDNLPAVIGRSDFRSWRDIFPKELLKISREHFRISYERGSFLLENLRDAGLVLEGTDLTGHPVELKPESSVLLGGKLIVKSQVSGSTLIWKFSLKAEENVIVLDAERASYWCGLHEEPEGDAVPLTLLFADLDRRSVLNDLMGQYRPHHYEMGHRELPKIFFADPENFKHKYPPSDHGRERLKSHWDTCGIHQAEPVEPEGMDIHLVMMGEKPGYLITMPQAVNPTEVVFVLLYINEKEGRYFTLELSDESDKNGPLGFVCEVLASSNRKNFNIYCPLKPEKFTAEVEKLIKRGPANSSVTKSVQRKNSVFRPEYCYFAFVGLPEFAREHIDDLVMSVECGRSKRILRTLLMGYFGDLSLLDELDAFEIADADKNYIIVKMLCPQAPPEPKYIGIEYIRNKEMDFSEPMYTCGSIYSLESADLASDNSWLLCHIDKKHSVITDLENPSAEDFAKAMTGHINRTLPPAEINIIDHLMLYPKVYEKDKWPEVKKSASQKNTAANQTASVTNPVIQKKIIETYKAFTNGTLVPLMLITFLLSLGFSDEFSIRPRSYAITSWSVFGLLLLLRIIYRKPNTRIIRNFAYGFVIFFTALEIYFAVKVDAISLAFFPLSFIMGFVILRIAVKIERFQGQ